jgi:hypothetical protein
VGHEDVFTGNKGDSCGSLDHWIVAMMVDQADEADDDGWQ